jgi:hypothetical protein
VKRLLFVLPLFVAVSCAGLGEYALEDPDGDGPAPPHWVNAVGEIADSGIGAFEQGGIAAGVIALVLTTGKTIMRWNKAIAERKRLRKVEVAAQVTESLKPPTVVVNP